MAQFRFYQDRKIVTWERDWYNIEADSIEDAIEFVRNNNENLDDLSWHYKDKVEFDEHDTECYFEPQQILAWEVFVKDDDDEPILVGK